MLSSPDRVLWKRLGPEIAIEILSPSNTTQELIAKRLKLFAAGTEQFWVLDPRRKVLSIWHRDGRTTVVNFHDTLRGEGIIQGFEMKLSDLFGAVPPEE